MNTRLCLAIQIHIPAYHFWDWSTHSAAPESVDDARLELNSLWGLPLANDSLVLQGYTICLSLRQIQMLRLFCFSKGYSVPSSWLLVI